MKSLLLVATLASTISINACPNLVGRYECVDTYSDSYETIEEKFTMTIQQNGNVYTVTDSEGTDTIVADGSTVVEEGLNMTTSCIGNKVIITAGGSFTADDGTVWTAVSEGEISKVGNVMTSITKGSSSSDSFSVEYTNTSVCTEI